MGGASYTVTATATSGLEVAFTAAAPSAGICAVSGATVTFVGAGACLIGADQAGSPDYLTAPPSSRR